MNRNKTDYYEIDLLRLAGALWKKLWLIVLVDAAVRRAGVRLYVLSSDALI